MGFFQRKFPHKNQTRTIQLQRSDRLSFAQPPCNEAAVQKITSGRHGLGKNAMASGWRINESTSFKKDKTWIDMNGHDIKWYKIIQNGSNESCLVAGTGTTILGQSVRLKQRWSLAVHLWHWQIFDLGAFHPKGLIKKHMAHINFPKGHSSYCFTALP